MKNPTDTSRDTATRSPVPVTVLTGFLGSGKTTVLNAVLADATAGRVAVIVNEFGEAGLDHDLIEEGGEEIVLMRSGCLCCSVRGDLSDTVANLFDRRAEGKIAFDRIVIETTGLADPGPILQTLRVDSFLARHTHVDGVVTVVDAAHGEATLDAQFEAVSQAAIADLLILSKTDRVPPIKAQRIEDRLRALNPTARCLRSVRGEGLAAELWGLSAMTPTAAPEHVIGWTLGVQHPADPLANLSGLAGPKAPTVPAAVHDARIGSASIILDAPIPDAAFDLWLDALIALRGRDILRVKGIVFLGGIEAPYVFHGVQHIFDPPVQLKDWPKGDRRSRIVVIARDLTRPQLQRSLDMLRARSTPSAPQTYEVLE